MTRSSSRRTVEPDPVIDWVFDALGTRWVMTVPGGLPDAVDAQVLAELDRIDVAWSRFRDDSTVAQAARRPGRYPIAPDDQPLIDWYRQLYDATDGAVTPFVGQTLVDAGYDAEYSLRPAMSVSAVPLWDDVLSGHDGELVVTTPALIDVGAAGKGFAVDRVAAIIAAHTDEFIVDGSGDLLISARDTPVRVALEHPLDPTQAIGVVEVADGAVCASAITRRAWADWHHVVDGRTARPTREVVATWALARSTMVADGLATALFFTSPDVLRARLGTDFRFVRVYDDGRADYSPWPGLELFT